MTTELLQLFESELSAYPHRASGAELYEYFNRMAARHVGTARPALVTALRAWILLKSEPRTMLAIDIAHKLRLTELRPEIERLLADVEQGKAFLSFYARPIRNALLAIET
jgi:hypothetical protein